MVVWEGKYSFIRDNIFLIARVNSDTGRQELVMRKINPETKEIEIQDHIECIHTAVMDMNADEFNRLVTDTTGRKELFKDTIFVRSSENLRKIDLSPSEKFIALNSWVDGIAEAGLDAFRICSARRKGVDLLASPEQPSTPGWGTSRSVGRDHRQDPRRDGASLKTGRSR